MGKSNTCASRMPPAHPNEETAKMKLRIAVPRFGQQRGIQIIKHRPARQTGRSVSGFGISLTWYSRYVDVVNRSRRDAALSKVLVRLRKSCCVRTIRAAARPSFGLWLPAGTLALAPSIRRATPELARGFCRGPRPWHHAIFAVNPPGGPGKLHEAFQNEA